MQNVTMFDEFGGFSLSYVLARATFLQAVQAAGLLVSNYPLSLFGHDGEALRVDAA